MRGAWGGEHFLWGGFKIMRGIRFSVPFNMPPKFFAWGAPKISWNVWVWGDPSHNKITLVYFPCLQSNNYLAQNTHLETKIYQFLKKLSSMAVYLVSTQTWQKRTSTTSFWIRLKLWVRDENYCHWGKFGEKFFLRGLIGVSYRDIASKTFLVIFKYKNNCH